MKQWGTKSLKNRRSGCCSLLPLSCSTCSSPTQFSSAEKPEAFIVLFLLCFRRWGEAKGGVRKHVRRCLFFPCLLEHQIRNPQFPLDSSGTTGPQPSQSDMVEMDSEEAMANKGWALQGPRTQNESKTALKCEAEFQHYLKCLSHFAYPPSAPLSKSLSFLLEWLQAIYTLTDPRPFTLS